jgi:uncharacterized membrane protein
MSILTIILSLVVIFVFGFIWYGPLFSKAWMRANNIPDDAPKNMKVSSFALNILGSLVMIVGYQFILFWFIGNNYTVSLSLLFALVAWLVFMVPAMFDAMAWKNVSWKGFLIDGIYRYLQLVIIGLFFLWL